MADDKTSTSTSTKFSGPFDSDWTCEECGNVNFARRTACNRCQKAKGPSTASKIKLGNKEIGKSVAEKSKGLFNPNDWQCNKCGNVNWFRRQECNVCNAPKCQEDEERTGLGGGYDDRGVVEYKEREESDDEFDEFDEFGRKKKKTSNNYASSNNSKDDEDEEKKKEEEEEDDDDDEEKKQEEEEEDDDDDDAGDLSKYDLSHWADSKEDTKKDDK